MYKCSEALFLLSSRSQKLINRSINCVKSNLFGAVSEKLFHNFIDVSDEVNINLCKKLKPVVALESTIITHGMPYPRNLQVAVEVEETVRSQGAIPATIGIIDGRIKVGLNYDELSRLATPPGNSDKSPIKTSRRDLPYVVGKGLCGGTTVSGTIVICYSVGIKIFVTGGIGGVHRDGQNTMDISADLIELSRHPITVVSSGVKSILDVQRTLEYLETLGVCVVTYGRTNDFPAFYTPKSGFKCPYNVSSIEEAVSLISTLNGLRLNSGLLLAVPVPSEYCSLDHGTVEKVIDVSLSEAKLKNISGKDVTPFLLKKINEMSNDQLLETNVGLIKNNALIGSKVAKQLHKNENNAKNDHTGYQSWEFDFTGVNKIKNHCIWNSNLNLQSFVSCEDDNDVYKRRSFSTDCKSPVIIGGSNLDCIVTPNEQLKDCSELLVCRDARTASCLVLLEPARRDNILLVGDMTIHRNISHQYLTDKRDVIESSRVVLIDGNLPIETMRMLLEECDGLGIPVWFEPTDMKIAHIPFTTDLWKRLTFISPNMAELRRINSAVMGTDCAETISTKEPSDANSSDDTDSLLKEALHLVTPLTRYINTIMVTLGQNGVLIVGKSDDNFTSQFSITSSAESNTVTDNQFRVTARYYMKPDVEQEQIVSVSGAGDCCVAGYMKGVLSGLAEPECMQIGLSAALDSLRSINTVPDQFQGLPDELKPHLPELVIPIE